MFASVPQTSGEPRDDSFQELVRHLVYDHDQPPLLMIMSELDVRADHTELHRAEAKRDAIKRHLRDEHGYLDPPKGSLEATHRSLHKSQKTRYHRVSSA